MGGFSFETKGANTYLVYKIGEEDVLDSMSLGMLTHNSITGLAATSFTQVDSDQYIKYNISSKISVKQIFSGIVNKKRLLSVLSGVVDAMLATEEYMIDVNSLMLDTEYIFADVSSYETVVICLPIENSEDRNIGAFFKNLIFNTQFDQSENCDHVAELLNFINSSPVFSLVRFKELLDKLSAKKSETNAPVRPKPQSPAVSSPVQTPARTYQPSVSAPVMQQPNTAAQNNQPVYRAPQSKEAPSKSETTQTEKKMSALYLLRHYSKENAEIYKAQKNEPKTASAKTEEKSKKEKKAKKSKTSDIAAPTKMDFAVPGQNPYVTPVQNPSPSPTPTQMATSSPAGEAVSGMNKGPDSNLNQAVRYTSADFGGTTVLNASGPKTTVLNRKMPESTKHAYLVRRKNNERISINKPVFRLGKEPSYADYIIADNPHVGRSHAEIHSRDGEYFLVDNNSMNHSFINGKQIPSSVECLLSAGDTFELADEMFSVKIE